MQAYNSIQELTKKLNELSQRLEISKLSQSELAEFEKLAQQLYERTIILHYKAKEESVYGEKEHSTVTETPLPAEPIEEIIQEEVAEGPVTETVIPEPKAPSTGEIEFDFSSDFEETPLAPTPEPEKEEETTVTELEKIIEPQTTPEPVNEAPVNGNDKNEAFYLHFEKAYHEALKDKLAYAKIQSLKGAFGLNDKLLFIKELFNGDAGEFNEIVDVLDQQDNCQAALQRLSAIAFEKNWDKEDSAVNDFVNMVNRRYVD